MGENTLTIGIDCGLGGRVHPQIAWRGGEKGDANLFLDVSWRPNGVWSRKLSC
jgi:hypothetical protein